MISMSHPLFTEALKHCSRGKKKFSNFFCLPADEIAGNNERFLDA